MADKPNSRPSKVKVAVVKTARKVAELLAADPRDIPSSGSKDTDKS